MLPGILIALTALIVLLAGLLGRSRAHNSALRRALEVHQRGLDQVANAVTITRASGRIEYVNTAFTLLTGYTAEEAMGSTPRILKSGHHGNDFYAKMWEHLKSGQPWHGEIVNRKKDGQLFVDEMTITPLRNAEGKLAHFIAVREDVSQRLQQQRLVLEHAEESIVPAMLDFLARTAHTQEELFNGVADLVACLHEFHGPLRAVFFTLAPGDKALRLALTRGDFSPEFLKGEEWVPLGKCLCGRAAVEGKVLVCENCFQDDRHELQWPGTPVHAHYTVPLKHNGIVVGVMNLYTAVGTLDNPRRVKFFTMVGTKVGAAMRALERAA